MEDLERELGSLLRKHEFRKKRRRWFRNGGDVIDLVELQAFSQGGGDFVNLGSYLRELGPLVEPASYDCHFARRVDNAYGRPVAEIVDEALAWFNARANRRKIEALLATGEHCDVMMGRELSKLKELPPLPPLPPPPAEVRVRHATFGEGVITRTIGQSVDVTFSDGTVRRVRRDFLEVVA